MAKKGRKDKARKQAARTQPDAPISSKPQSEAPDQPERAQAEPSNAVEPAFRKDAGAEPASGNRLLSNAFIALFLAYQLAMPLRYYLGGRGYDERFSWRMFSTLRLQECKVHVEELAGGEPRTVDLQQELHLAWIGMLERYRRPVIDKLLARRCAEQGVREVRYERSCIDTNGSALPATTVMRDCASGRLVAHEGAQERAHEGAQGAVP